MWNPTTTITFTLMYIITLTSSENELEADSPPIHTTDTVTPPTETQAPPNADTINPAAGFGPGGYDHLPPAYPRPPGYPDNNIPPGLTPGATYPSGTTPGAMYPPGGYPASGPSGGMPPFQPGMGPGVGPYGPPMGPGQPGVGPYGPPGPWNGVGRCKYWCRDNWNGRFYCCVKRDAAQKRGACPNNARRPCYANDWEQYCSADFQCRGKQKCCYDDCLNARICKLPGRIVYTTYLL